jgi:hypothetical protein
LKKEKVAARVDKAKNEGVGQNNRKLTSKEKKCLKKEQRKIEKLSKKEKDSEVRDRE